MRDYAKVSPAFWTKGSGKALRGDRDAQIVALYLVTCPSANMIGLYYLPMTLLVHETGLTTKGASEALARVSNSGFAYFDPDSELVWVPNAAAYQIGDTLSGGDLRKKGVLRELYQYRTHRFSLEFFDRYSGPFGLEEPEWLDRKLKPLPSQDQDQEQEQEQDQEQEQEQNHVRVSAEPGQAVLSLVEPRSSVVRKRDPRLAEIHAVFAVWAKNRKAKHPRGTEPKLDDERAKHIRARLAEGFDVETLKLAVEGVWRCAWNLGQNDRETEYCDIRHALGDARKVEKFAEIAITVRDMNKREPIQPAEPVAPQSVDNLPEVG